MTDQTYRLLIIGRDLNGWSTLCNCLEIEGFDVAIAQMVRDKVDGIDMPSCDVVLVGMPSIHSDEANSLYRIQTNQSDVRIVMLAPSTSGERTDGAVALGAATLKRVPKEASAYTTCTVLRVRAFVSNGNDDAARVLSTGPAARRWAAMVADVRSAPEDVPTVSAWSKRTARSRGTIKAWCANVGVSAGDSLDFARLLRAIRDHEGQPWDLLNILDVADRRTILRLCDRAGLSREMIDKAPPIDVFMSTQRLVCSKTLLSAIKNVITRTRSMNDRIALSTRGTDVGRT